MKTSKQLQLAADLAAEYEQGKSPEWEAHVEHSWVRFTTLHSLQRAIRDGCTIRRVDPDWQLPPPPPGREWQRADKWTKDMLPEGYRPMLIGETGSYEYRNAVGKWEDGSCMTIPTSDEHHPNRTNRPLPGTTPLTAADVPFGARFRRDPTEVLIGSVMPDRLLLLVGVILHYTWDEVAKRLEMSTDGINWKPCTK